MNGICKVLDCFYGAQFDPGNDEWIAIKVYRDGNTIEICRCATEEEAEKYAGEQHAEAEDLQANSQFGAGA
jgi:hypothetical protein